MTDYLLILLPLTYFAAAFLCHFRRRVTERKALREHLGSLTIRQLKALAKEKQLRKYSYLSKKQLAEALYCCF